ncbi:sulfurtransferase [Candidatus Parcubacteria bacterium]|nr:MAG: sulfurtransferase [Candidatus Parcubacteria bacterium]
MKKILLFLILSVALSGCTKASDKNTETQDNSQAYQYQSINVQTFDEMLQNKDFTLVDVHIPEQSHISKTDLFIPYHQIEDNLSQLPQDKEQKIVVYCRSGSMSKTASKALIDMGYKNVYNLLGGKNAYNAYKN